MVASEGIKSLGITELLQRIRVWVRRRDHGLRYVWVAELQQRVALHYHLLLWLPRGLTLPEFDRLLRELPEHLADMAVFAVATGLRAANVKGLLWQYVDIALRHAWVPGSQHKNGAPHSVPLNEMALSVVRKQIGKHHACVFTYRASSSVSSTPRRGRRRCSERASKTSNGTICATPLRLGTGRPERPRTS